MAQEEKRGCGYRKVGGLYLVGEGEFKACDRLPIPLEHCPICGEGIYFSRSPKKINPYHLFGVHYVGIMGPDVPCDCDPCHCCRPPDETAFLMWIGEKFYTPYEFIVEAQTMGVSKRIAFIPRDLEIGKTRIYCAHKKAIVIEPEGGGPVSYQAGVFFSFTPSRIEKLIWKKDATKANLKRLEKQGITPVIIADGDKDHE